MNEYSGTLVAAKIKKIWFDSLCIVRANLKCVKMDFLEKVINIKLPNK